MYNIDFKSIQIYITINKMYLTKMFISMFSFGSSHKMILFTTTLFFTHFLACNRKLFVLFYEFPEDEWSLSGAYWDIQSDDQSFFFSSQFRHISIRLSLQKLKLFSLPVVELVVYISEWTLLSTKYQVFCIAYIIFI